MLHALLIGDSLLIDLMLFNMLVMLFNNVFIASLFSILL